MPRAKQRRSTAPPKTSLSIKRAQIAANPHADGQTDVSRVLETMKLSASFPINRTWANFAQLPLKYEDIIDTFFSESFEYVVKEILSEEKEDSSAPPLCLRGLANALVTVLGTLNKDGKHSYEDIRKRRPNVLVAFFDFTLTKTDENDINDFQRKRAICRCNKRDAVLDMLHLDLSSFGIITYDLTDQAPIQVITRCLFMILANLVDVGFNIVDRYQLRMVKRRTKKKLMGASRYLQGKDGLEQTVQACYRWFQHTKNCLVVAFLGKVLLYFPSAVTPKILKFGGPLVSLIVADLYNVVHTLRHDQDAGISIRDRLDANVNFFFQLFAYIDTGDQVQLYEENFRTLLTDHVETLRDSCVDFLEALENPQSFPAMTQLIDSSLPNYFAIFMCTLFGIFDVAEANIPPCIRKFAAIDIYEQQGVSPYLETWATLSVLLTESKCFNIPCGKAPSKGDHAFQKCSKCLIGRYCSRDCQRQAWSCVSAPHKQVCSDWEILSKIWPLNESTSVKVGTDDYFKSLAEPHGFTHEKILLLHQSAFSMAELLKQSTP